MRLKPTTIAAAVCLLIVVAAGRSSARDLYVNNVTGDDRASGRSAEVTAANRPLRTISRALRLVNPGGRIILAKTDEPYREMISLSDAGQRGYSDQPLVIQGNGATLDGTVTAALGAWKHERDGIFAMRPRRLTYQQLFLNGEPLRHVRSAGKSDSALSLQPLEWTLRPNRVLFCIEEGRVPDQYNLRHCGLQTGITLYNTQHVRIEDLVVQGFQQDGINAHELVNDCQLVRVECRANGRSGISVGGVSQVEITESSCYDNGSVQLRLEGQAEVTAQQSDFARDDPAAPWIEVHGEAHAVIDGQEFRMSDLKISD